MANLAWNPPRYLLAPHPAEAIATAVSGAALVVLVLWSCRDWIRGGDRLGPFVIIGGSIAAFQEPIVDSLGHIFLRTNMPAFTTLGRSIPFWGVLAYGGFYGTGTYLIYRFARRGADRRTLRTVVAAIVLANLVLEPVLIAVHLYTYYGRQPLRLIEFPVFWPFINVPGQVLGAMVLIKQPQWFSGWRVALGLLLVPVAVVAGSLASGLPVFSVLNASGRPSGALLSLAALITIVFGVLVMEGAVRALAPSVRVAGTDVGAGLRVDVA